MSQPNRSNPDNGDSKHPMQVFEILAELRREDGEGPSDRFDLESQGTRFLELFDLAPGSYVETDLEGVIKLANLEACELLQTRQSQLVGTPLERFVEAGSRDGFHRSLGGLRADDVNGWDTRVQPVTGSPREVYVSVRRGWERGGTGVLRWLLHDITERKQREEGVGYIAHHDPLTDLPNRELLGEHLGLALARARRRNLGVAVLMLDIDGFGLINDRLGRAAGDEVLVQLASRLREVSRGSDLVCRFGGDEFAVLVSDLDLSGNPSGGVGGVPLGLERMARRIREALDAPYKIDGMIVRAPVSAGLSVFPTDASDARTLMLRADLATYRNKAVTAGAR